MRTSIRALAPLIVALGLCAPAAAQEHERPPASRWSPAGTVHLVLQAGAIGQLLAEPEDTSFFAGGELAVGADVRLAQEAHLRALLVGAGQTYDDQRLTRADGEVVERSGTGFVTGGVRLIVGLVLVPFLALRVGAELGFEGIASVGRMTSYGGGLVEAALRLTDEERLELLLQVAVQSRARGRWVRTDPPSDAESEHFPAGRLMLGVGWVF
ncbi:hypothetical protein [Sandaracinus amylolyticus]|uniref:Outer membrane protein beta-barrel domain-containing protein n=1 Tax=Sandaracinus amylolyticus TaxID=927083 RepID=A0A0F6VZF9_9BACT|nr:hypothetical protein [Sandaracinus amylolyticus]AKF03543.1 hypothetical protein DB32_000692 [Sandaracinus amylolyticus]